MVGNVNILGLRNIIMFCTQTTREYMKISSPLIDKLLSQHWIFIKFTFIQLQSLSLVPNMLRFCGHSLWARTYMWARTKSILNSSCGPALI